MGDDLGRALKVGARFDGRTIGDIAVDLHRPSVSRLFIGKLPDVVIKTVPYLFTRCAHAQRAAAVAAVNVALGETLREPAHRELWIEVLHENLWRLLLDLSFIKTHWPYIAPAPYHAMYGAGDVIPLARSDLERQEHPVYRAFMENRIGRSFSRDEVREAVIPVYMGLISQIDDQLGLLFDFLEARGLTDETLIVFTSDHGDYLGDHWLGEKDLFHEPSVKVPLIVADPRAGADAMRGTISDALVETIDLLPTFIEAAGGDAAAQAHRLELVTRPTTRSR